MPTVSRTVIAGDLGCILARVPAIIVRTGMYFDGLIDEVRIFDHALTPGEVSQEAVHYWCDSLAETAPLLQYTFDEGGGLTVHDESPYHNDLSIAAAEQIGHAAWSSNGICNHALEFDTENGGDCVQGMPIPIAESVTFSMWVYLHDMVPQAIQSMHCKSVTEEKKKEKKDWSWSILVVGF